MAGAPPTYDSMYWQGPRVTVKQTGTRRKRGSVSLEGYGILGESDMSSPSVQVGTADKLGEFLKMAAFDKQAALDKLAVPKLLQLGRSPILRAGGKVIEKARKVITPPKVLPEGEAPKPPEPPAGRPLPSEEGEKPKTLGELGKRVIAKEDVIRKAREEAISPKLRAAPIRRAVKAPEPRKGEPTVTEAIPGPLDPLRGILGGLVPAATKLEVPISAPRGRKLTAEQIAKLQRQVPAGKRLIFEREPGKVLDPMTARESLRSIKETLKEKAGKIRRGIGPAAKKLIPLRERFVGRKAFKEMYGEKPGLLETLRPGAGIRAALARGAEVKPGEIAARRAGKPPEPVGVKPEKELAARAKKAAPEISPSEYQAAKSNIVKRLKAGALKGPAAAEELKRAQARAGVREHPEVALGRKVEKGLRGVPGVLPTRRELPVEGPEREITELTSEQMSAYKKRQTDIKRMKEKARLEAGKPKIEKALGEIRAKQKRAAEPGVREVPKYSVVGRAASDIEGQIAAGKMSKEETTQAQTVANRLKALAYQETGPKGRIYPPGHEDIQKIVKGTPFEGSIEQARARMEKAPTPKPMPVGYEQVPGGALIPRKEAPAAAPEETFRMQMQAPRTEFKAPEFRPDTQVRGMPAFSEEMSAKRNQWETSMGHIEKYYPNFNRNDPASLEWLTTKDKKRDLEKFINADLARAAKETGAPKPELVKIPTEMIEKTPRGGPMRVLERGMAPPQPPAPSPQQLGALMQMMAPAFAGGMPAVGPQPAAPQIPAQAPAAPTQIPASLTPLVQRLALMQGGQAEAQPSFQQAMKQVGARGQMPGWLGMAGTMLPLMLAQSMGMTGLAPTMGALIGGPMAAEGLARRFGYGPERMQQAQQAYLRGNLSEEEYRRQLGQATAGQQVQQPMDWMSAIRGMMGQQAPPQAAR